MADFEFATRDDFQNMVDAQIEETLTLEYKASPSLARESRAENELCKDVSAMANSAGGQIIYGIEENGKTHKPSKVDDGVTDEKITREWLHQILSSRVHPRMDGIKINRVELSAKGYGYVISVESTQSGPHQAPDKKYYKRFELQSVPMEDYEIRDILRRATTPDLEAVLWFDTGEKFATSFDPHQEYSQTFSLNCGVINKATAPAHYVIFEVWIDDDLKVPFADPFKQVNFIEESPKRRFRVFRRTISAPPGVPIFKEASDESHTAKIALQLPSKLLGSSIIHLQTHIAAPGFSKRSHHAIRVEQNMLTLIHPDSPFLR